MRNMLGGLTSMNLHGEAKKIRTQQFGVEARIAQHQALQASAKAALQQAPKNAPLPPGRTVSQPQGKAAAPPPAKAAAPLPPTKGASTRRLVGDPCQHAPMISCRLPGP